MLRPEEHLARIDPVLRPLIERIGPCRLRVERSQEPWRALVKAITSQQIHIKVAARILERLSAVIPEKTFPDPEDLLGLDEATLRGCGLSAAKTAAVRDVAKHSLSGLVPTRRAAHRLSDEDLIERLVQIRGIGRWSVEMLLIFTLGRPDILPVGDFAVREGFRITAGLETQPKPRDLALLGERWAPYRSTVAWYLWRSRDGRLKSDETQGRTPRTAPNAG